jgi:HPt (histidine-containing phosphotransfer) domain-containing protein
MTVQELYQQIDGDYEAVKKIMMTDGMISRFVVKLVDDRSFDTLMAAGESMDAAALFSAAHTAKGVAANLGLNKLSRMASEITEEFRPGTERTMSDAEVGAKMEEIRALYERTLEGIRAFAAN